MFFEPRDGMRPSPLKHNPINAIVCPRPIGWISTLTADGIPNVAPFSYFNAVSADPPYVMFAPNTKAPGEVKDSYENLRAVPEFVASIVSAAQGEMMNATSAPFENGVNEFEVCGIEAAPSRCVRPPRVASSRAALECRVHDILTLPKGADGRDSRVVIGEVVGIHIDDAMIEDGRVNEAALDPLARLGYSNYSTLGEIREILRPR
jgi:flavin reductase (DIM6/NTAB) family NADH-FMN oxidoreductase RutF